MNYRLFVSKHKLRAEEFIELSQSVGWWRGKVYDMKQVSNALKKSSFIVTARDQDNRAIACARALSDDMFFTTIPDIFVRPEYQWTGIGKMLINKIIEKYSHTTIFFGSQPGNEWFFEKLWFSKGLQSYSMKKEK